MYSNYIDAYRNGSELDRAVRVMFSDIQLGCEEDDDGDDFDLVDWLEIENSLNDIELDEPDDDDVRQELEWSISEAEDLGDFVDELSSKYVGKPRFASYSALKKEEGDSYWWGRFEKCIREFDQLPANYFKEVGLVRSGKEKVQTISITEERERLIRLIVENPLLSEQEKRVLKSINYSFKRTE